MHCCLPPGCVFEAARSRSILPSLCSRRPFPACVSAHSILMVGAPRWRGCQWLVVQLLPRESTLGVLLLRCALPSGCCGKVIRLCGMLRRSQWRRGRPPAAATACPGAGAAARQPPATSAAACSEAALGRMRDLRCARLRGCALLCSLGTIGCCRATCTKSALVERGKAGCCAGRLYSLRALLHLCSWDRT